MSRGILWLITTFIWLVAIVVTHAAALESLSDAGPLTPAFRWGYAAAFLVFGILLTGAAARMWPDAGPTIWRPFAVVFGAVVVLFELWLQSQQRDGRIDPGLVVQNVLRKTRLQIVEGRLESESWYQKLDEEARNQYRLSGRSLIQGLMGHLSSPDSNSMEAEARSLGYEYASRGRRYGLSSAEAAHAFMFFRNMLLEEMFDLYETAGVRSPRAWGEMFRKMNEFADQIMLTLLETYDAFQRSGR